MSNSSLLAIVGEEIYEEQWWSKWSTFVNGKDGFLYGIPCEARRVVKFSPVDKSMEMIGPDLGDDKSWDCGVLANNGCIYCPPDCLRNGKMLKINTKDGTVVTFDTEDEGWISGALGADNCIYYMPLSWYANMNHVLRVDPHTDTLSYIRVPSSRCVGTVLGKDNCIYGLSIPSMVPFHPSSKFSVIRFDPMEPENISYIANDGNLDHIFESDGVLGNDGHIYALNGSGQVLKVDTSAQTIDLIGERLFDDQGHFTQPIIGLDQCIYWPTRDFRGRVLKFDPVTQHPPSFVGSSTTDTNDYNKNVHGWLGGALASDGVIYYAPFLCNQVLAIDPLRELSVTMKQMFRSYPNELGRLFLQNNESYRESLFESAVRKFGFERALCLLDECLPTDDEWAERQSSFDSVPLVKLEASGGKKRKRSSDNLPAVSVENVGDVPLSVIYHLVRRNVNGLLRS